MNELEIGNSKASLKAKGWLGILATVVIALIAGSLYLFASHSVASKSEIANKQNASNDLTVTTSKNSPAIGRVSGAGSVTITYEK